MMFFNSNKKIAGQISAAIENALKPAFTMTDHLDGGNFKPPENFWSDDYILGFIHLLTGMFMKFDFGSDRMSNKKKGEIVVHVFQNLCGDDWKQALAKANENATSQRNEQYDRGRNAAETLYLANTGRLSLDDPDPILQEARSLASSFDGEELLGETSESKNLGAAIFILTINKHINEEYLSDAA